MNEVDIYKYSKKQLHQLYMDAACDEIMDTKFARIAIALHELVHLGQYSYDSFQYLVDVLLNLSNSAISDIVSGNYRKFYEAFYNHTAGMPEDYYVLTDLMAAMYFDYKNANIDNYNWLCDDCMLQIYEVCQFNDDRINDSLKQANYSLYQLLNTLWDNIDMDVLKMKRNTIEDNMARRILITHLLVTFLMHEEDYDGQYQLPVNLFNHIVSKISEDEVIKISRYLRYDNNSDNVAKELLTAWNSNKLNNDDCTIEKVKLLRIKSKLD